MDPHINLRRRSARHLMNPYINLKEGEGRPGNLVDPYINLKGFARECLQYLREACGQGSGWPLRVVILDGILNMLLVGAADAFWSNNEFRCLAG